jgi:hypothetical protein
MKTNPKEAWKLMKNGIFIRDKYEDRIYLEGQSASQSILSHFQEQCSDPGDSFENRKPTIQLPPLHITTQKIKEILSNVNTNKAMGGDFIPMEILDH